jgi:hypothetical protein
MNPHPPPFTTLPVAARFNPSSSWAQRAQQAWPILVGKAMRRQTTTYHKLSKLMYQTSCPHVLSQPLGHIAYWCQDHSLPGLNLLCVQKASGQPGPGCPPALLTCDLKLMHELIYAIDWYDIVPPTVADLDTAWHRHT